MTTEDFILLQELYIHCKEHPNRNKLNLPEEIAKLFPVHKETIFRDRLVSLEGADFGNLNEKDIVDILQDYFNRLSMGFLQISETNALIIARGILRKITPTKN